MVWSSRGGVEQQGGGGGAAEGLGGVESERDHRLTAAAG